MSWNDLTVNEIKAVLDVHNIQYNKTDIKKKSQIVDICKRRLKRKDLLKALQQYKKLPDSDDDAIRNNNNNNQMDDSVLIEEFREALQEQQHLMQQQQRQKQKQQRTRSPSSLAGGQCFSDSSNRRSNSRDTLRTPLSSSRGPVAVSAGDVSRPVRTKSTSKYSSERNSSESKGALHQGYEQQQQRQNKQQSLLRNSPAGAAGNRRNSGPLQTAAGRFSVQTSDDDRSAYRRRQSLDQSGNEDGENTAAAAVGHDYEYEYEEGEDSSDVENYEPESVSVTRRKGRETSAAAPAFTRFSTTATDNSVVSRDSEDQRLKASSGSSSQQQRFGSQTPTAAVDRSGRSSVTPFNSHYSNTASRSAASVPAATAPANVADDFISGSLSPWPVLDPAGKPILWRIRASIAEQPTPTATTAGNSSNRKQQPHQHQQQSSSLSSSSSSLSSSSSSFSSSFPSAGKHMSSTDRHCPKVKSAAPAVDTKRRQVETHAKYRSMKMLSYLLLLMILSVLFVLIFSRASNFSYLDSFATRTLSVSTVAVTTFSKAWNKLRSLYEEPLYCSGSSGPAPGSTSPAPSADMPIRHTVESYSGGRNAANCIACPDNAVCVGGRMRCKEPQYVKQWKQQAWICSKNDEIYRVALKALGGVSQLLSIRAGEFKCLTNCININNKHNSLFPGLINRVLPSLALSADTEVNISSSSPVHIRNGFLLGPFKSAADDEADSAAGVSANVGFTEFSLRRSLMLDPSIKSLISSISINNGVNYDGEDNNDNNNNNNRRGRGRGGGRGRDTEGEGEVIWRVVFDELIIRRSSSSSSSSSSSEEEEENQKLFNVRVASKSINELTAEEATLFRKEEKEENEGGRLASSSSSSSSSSLSLNNNYINNSRNNKNSENTFLLYYSTIPQKSWSCKSVEVSLLYLVKLQSLISFHTIWSFNVYLLSRLLCWKSASVLFVCLTLRYLLIRFSFPRRLKAAIRQIITDRTKPVAFQFFCSPSSVGAGAGFSTVGTSTDYYYVSGPTAREIHNALKTHFSRSPYYSSKLSPSSSFSSSLCSSFKAILINWIFGKPSVCSEATVERICNEIVRSDSEFCRGILASNQTTFFYSSTALHSSSVLVRHQLQQSQQSQQAQQAQ